MTKDIQDWLLYLASTNILRYLVLIVLAGLLIAFAHRMLKKHITDNAVKYKSQKAVEVLGYVFILFISVFYFSGNINDFGLAVGLLTAGVTITLQELILSIAGSLYIFLVKVYHPGDRIELNGIKGDVIDIDSI